MQASQGYGCLPVNSAAGSCANSEDLDQMVYNLDWLGPLLFTHDIHISPENVPLDMCTHWRSRSARMFAQSDQNLHWEYFG